MQIIRKDLGIHIFCNEAAKNVYPSPMLLNMGEGKAYMIKWGHLEKIEYIVGIFEMDESLEFSSIKDQSK